MLMLAQSGHAKHLKRYVEVACQLNQPQFILLKDNAADSLQRQRVQLLKCQLAHQQRANQLARGAATAANARNDAPRDQLPMGHRQIG